MGTMGKVLALAAALLLSGCGTDSPEDAETAYQANLSKWKGKKTSSYSYDLSIDCYCLVTGKVRVTVEADTVAKVDSLPGRESPEVAPEDYRSVPTIDELFAHVESALNCKAEVLKVEYHAEQGYPSKITIDYDQEAWDDDFGFLASGLSPE
jgi:hypothetical protein